MGVGKVGVDQMGVGQMVPNRWACRTVSVEDSLQDGACVQVVIQLFFRLHTGLAIARPV